MGLVNLILPCLGALKPGHKSDRHRYMEGGACVWGGGGFECDGEVAVVLLRGACWFACAGS